MKFFTSKETTKKIIIAILLVMTFNFITPVASQADDDYVFGGKLFEPLCQLVCSIGDLFMRLMQKFFMGYGDIEGQSINTFNIRYSPGVIFSNKVAGLDVNFIKPNEFDTLTIEKYDYEDITDESKEKMKEILKKEVKDNPDMNWGDYLSMYTNDNLFDFYLEYYNYYSSSTKSTYESTDASGQTLMNYEWINEGHNNAIDSILTFDYHEEADQTRYKMSFRSGGNEWKLGNIISNYNAAWDNITNKLEKNVYTISKGVNKETVTIDKESSAKTLQKTVSTWYKALRAFALVGLLSVLVYIGIRILISSTGQEKSKYKKMIIDWVAAICILFVLQYIMIFTLKITESITKVISVQVIGEDGRDNLISDIRGYVGNDDETRDYSDLEVFSNTIMYIALVIETGIFSVHYLKRLVYMAFFTMIAPLIALTYPLDKIKDGQAQAFGTWLREYIFNALIQPVHLLLYYMFITSAMDLATNNPLYAVVALGFMMPAEKFFRKMFGFEKASSVSPVGAAAGGALVMNAINKMGQRSGKQAAGKASGGSSTASGKQAAGTRMASENPLSALTGESSAGGSSGTSSTRGTGTSGSGSSPAGGTGTPSSGASKPKKDGRFIRGARGVGNVLKNQTFTRSAAQRNLRAMAGIAGGALGTTIGLGAGVATGDLGNALKYGAAGAGAGFMGGKGLVNAGFNTYDSAVRGIDNIRYDYQTGALGEEEANNRKFNREFKRSDDYKKMLKNYGDSAEGNIDQMLNAGITDPTRMNTILKNMKNIPGTDIRHAIAYNQLANDCGDSVLYDDKKLRMFLDKRGISASNDAELEKLRKSIVDFK